ncbi:MAG: thiamine pyrophosphate-binding protein [Gammaproteobacteria bacterium]|nr:thiamine pyrophosphate-binding protein [Gammaproteobacteria bacterium]
MKVQVSELIVKYMERLGIETIFGMPGAHILPVYDSLYDSPIQSVLAKHEQGAAFMACGYNRASGKIGACITTAGPGATNLVTGIANAYADRQAILIITGETPTYIFGKGGLQESSGEGGSINQCALFDSITRYSRVIERTDYLENVLNQASKILLSDNSGPVLLSLPFNVQKEMVELDILENITTSKRSPAKKLNGSQPDSRSGHQVEHFVNLLRESKQPVIVSGYGCIKSGAQSLVTELSHSLNIPVTSSLKGKGTINECSELSLGSLGVTSSGYAYDYIVNKSDLVIVLGASFNERTSYLWNDKLLGEKNVIQIDINDEQLNKVYQADLTIHADIRQTLGDVMQRLGSQSIEKKQLENISEYKDKIESRAASEGNSIFQAEFSLVKTFFEKMNTAFPEGISIFDDNIIFAQNLLQVSTKNNFYPNAGISSLGHAIPAAIGAQFAEQTTMFAIIGDGGFQMCCMEIMTAVNYKKPLNIVLFNNSSMGLIRKNQIQSYDNRFIDCDFDNPDYKKLAESFGINHVSISSEENLDSLFNDFDLTSGINLIEIIIDKNAFPNYSSRR